MSQVLEPQPKEWTAADLVARFGPIPLSRIRLDPAPGTATVEDVVRLDDHKDRLCELVDGVLVEKPMGFYESYLAMLLGRLLVEFVEKTDLGIVAGEAGMLQLFPNQVRIPDLSFLSWDSLSETRLGEHAAPEVAPDLAVEIISRSNTEREMDVKLGEYFTAGARQVWYIYPELRTVHVFTAPEEKRVLTEGDRLDGGDLLPGFELDLRDFFTPPKKR